MSQSPLLRSAVVCVSLSGYFCGMPYEMSGTKLFAGSHSNFVAAPGLDSGVSRQSPSEPATPSKEVQKPLHAPSFAELQSQLKTWMEQRNLDQAAIHEAVGSEWDFEAPPRPDQLFDALMRTFYLADEPTRSLVEACREWRLSPDLLQNLALTPEQEQREPLLTNNVRYFLARYLTQLTAFNEALAIFDQIDPEWVVDPAGFLFHKAVCEHHLLLKEQGLETTKTLLSLSEEIPLRYRKLAELMQDDLEQLKEKSLGEVARQMKDVERRLALQQTDDGVQEVENKIIQTLDELIKQMEDQQAQQNSASSAGGAGNQSGKIPQSPSNEAPNGGQMEMTPNGETQAGGRDHWGDLPPKEKEAAKNMLETEFPAHYRAAVEQYLKKLAERPAAPK